MGLIDLDRFKAINDIHGHGVGDETLITVAKCLNNICPEGTLVGRLGGDEFAILLSDYADEAELADLGAKICAALAVGRKIGEAIINPRGSIGFATFPHAASTKQELYDAADFALYSAKAIAPGSTKLFDHSHKAELERLSLIECALNRSDSAEFRMQYQPIVTAADGKTVGFEALARWRCPELGDLMPEEFVPIAERMSFINSLTRILLKRALSDAATWPDDLSLSVNLSSHDLASLEFAQELKAIIVQSGFDPKRLIIEMTETAIIRDTQVTRDALQMFKELGVQVALDDFGTGYSSLLHLQNFSIHRIKVDRSLTHTLGKDADKRVIVQMVIDMCNSLGIDCVIEGVEDDETRAQLIRMQANYLQGYLFARPMEVEEIPDFLQPFQTSTLAETHLDGADWDEAELARSAG